MMRAIQAGLDAFRRKSGHPPALLAEALAPFDLPEAEAWLRRFLAALHRTASEKEPFSRTG
jgi:hypothetical protein